MHYTHLAEEERYYLCRALKSGKSMRAAAKEIGRNVSTVSRELARNAELRGYRYKQADAKSRERQACKGKTESRQRHGSRLSRDCALITALSKSLARLPCKG
jgi:IS30 family transposase